jgi:hypothetical protein
MGSITELDFGCDLCDNPGTGTLQVRWQHIGLESCQWRWLYIEACHDCAKRLGDGQPTAVGMDEDGARDSLDWLEPATDPRSDEVVAAADGEGCPRCGNDMHYYHCTDVANVEAVRNDCAICHDPNATRAAQVRWVCAPPPNPNYKGRKNNNPPFHTFITLELCDGCMSHLTEELKGPVESGPDMEDALEKLRMMGGGNPVSPGRADAQRS